MSPTVNEIHLVLVTCYILNGTAPKIDACLVMMYKISHDKVAVSKSDRLSGPPLPRYTPEICTLSHIRSHYVEHNRKGHNFPSHHCRLERLPQTAVLSDSAEFFRAAIISSYP
jgi:hypothetical protein